MAFNDGVKDWQNFLNVGKGHLCVQLSGVSATSSCRAKHDGIKYVGYRRVENLRRKSIVATLIFHVVIS